MSALFFLRGQDCRIVDYFFEQQRAFLFLDSDNNRMLQHQDLVA
jgi:hypothetical protein